MKKDIGDHIISKLDLQDILQWFKLQFEKLKQAVLPQQSRSRGIG